MFLLLSVVDLTWSRHGPLLRKLNQKLINCINIKFVILLYFSIYDFLEWGWAKVSTTGVSDRSQFVKIREEKHF